MARGSCRRFDHIGVDLTISVYLPSMRSPVQCRFTAKRSDVSCHAKCLVCMLYETACRLSPSLHPPTLIRIGDSDPYPSLIQPGPARRCCRSRAWWRGTHTPSSPPERCPAPAPARPPPGPARPRPSSCCVAQSSVRTGRQVCRDRARRPERRAVCGLGGEAWPGGRCCLLALLG